MTCEEGFADEIDLSLRLNEGKLLSFGPSSVEEKRSLLRFCWNGITHIGRIAILKEVPDSLWAFLTFEAPLSEKVVNYFDESSSNTVLHADFGTTYL